jgi:hypothetical protein
VRVAVRGCVVFGGGCGRRRRVYRVNAWGGGAEAYGSLDLGLGGVDRWDREGGVSVSG